MILNLLNSYLIDPFRSKRFQHASCVFIILLLSSQVFAQQKRTVTGTVTSREDDETLPGVNIILKNDNTKGAITNLNGEFSMEVTSGDTLVFTFIGFLTQEVAVGSRSVLNVSLSPDLKSLEEVVVVGFGEQKKASLVSSITSVNVKELKTPTANLTNAIAGKVAGVISFQQSGEPGMGTDNSTFYIRGLSTFGSGKRDPLILIDGIESTPTDMARLQPDDISDFSVLKDAAASSIYGARGANGVVLINTKMGEDGPVKVSFRAENRVSSNTRNFRLADNITYMTMANEAATTRSPNAIRPYTQNKINATRDGADPYLFPNNNWIDQMIKDYTVNQGYNINLSGGNAKSRFYLAGTYNRDNGILKVDPINNFNSNILLNNYSIRSNVDFSLSKTTKLIARIYGQFDDYNGPIGTPDRWGKPRSGGATAFDNALRSNPVAFPAIYPRDKRSYVDHPLFGSAPSQMGGALSNFLYVNPYAEMVKGYQTIKTSNLNPQLEIHQDLKFITEGLNFRAMSYVKRTSLVSLNRFYNPFFYTSVINPEDGSYAISVMNDGSRNSIGQTGTEYLSYEEDRKEVNSQFWAQAIMDYNRTFNLKHSVSGMLVTFMSHYESGNAGSLIRSLPNRNNGLSGRFTYGFDERYLAEINFGYNGSERFAEQNRYGFFPSGGIGYRISNESFFAPLKGTISNLKFRATYGLVGNDQIGDQDQRFLYMSEVDLNNPVFGTYFGRNDGAAFYSRPGVSINRYSNEAITWEQSRQLNVGMDLNMGTGVNAFELIIDAFKQYRSNILQTVTYFDNATGLMAIPFSNYGKAESQGVDLSTNFQKIVSTDLSVELRGTFTYATSKIIRVDELAYQDDLSHLSKQGHSLGQQWGYIAERLFVDDEEVANSPVQFGDRGLLAGDIKYRDITGDGLINSDDMVPIGYPKEPEIMYGFGSNIRYKKFDVNIFFQGSARSSFLIDPRAMQPFYQEGGHQNGLLQVVADDHWSEENRNLYAFWPRMSTWRVEPNNQPSTWWLRNGSFLRLKNIDIGYSLDKMERFGFSNARIYFSAINLMSFSNFKMWDVEMGGNGMSYPIQSVYNLGLSVNF